MVNLIFDCDGTLVDSYDAITGSGLPIDASSADFVVHDLREILSLPLE